METMLVPQSMVQAVEALLGQYNDDLPAFGARPD